MYLKTGFSLLWLQNGRYYFFLMSAEYDAIILSREDRIFNHSLWKVEIHLLQTPKMHWCCLLLHSVAVLVLLFPPRIQQTKIDIHPLLQRIWKKTFHKHQWFKSDWIKYSPKAVKLWNWKCLIMIMSVIVAIGHLEIQYNQIN